MNEKRKYVIENLLMEGFIESESEVIQLEEKEESGKSLLEIHLKDKENLSIKNIDMKNTQMYYFRSDKNVLGDIATFFIFKKYPYNET